MEVAGQPRYKGLMEGLRLMMGEGSQLSYMANRLLEMPRVLKDTGSIYLHCDPTMSHYLKERSWTEFLGWATSEMISYGVPMT